MPISARDIIDVLKNVVIIAGGLTGAAFGVYRYKKSREAESTIEIDLIVDQHTAGAVNVADVTIGIKNVGKSAVFCGLDQQREGAVCTIRKLAALQADSSQILWKGEHTCDLIPPANYMMDWLELSPNEPVIFEPGTTSRFHVVFSTEFHGLIWIRADLVDRKTYTWRAERLFSLP